VLKQRTLFVIGAGASKELDFPTGVELLSHISQKLKFELDGFNNVQGDQRFWSAVKKLCSERNANINDYFAATGEMRSGLNLAQSIDNYVHTHSDKPIFLDLAKLAIALFILAAEGSVTKNVPQKPLKSTSSKPDYWLSVFCRHHFAGYKSFSLDSLFDNVAFISFNYDRCIEHNLRTNVANYFGLDDNRAIEICNKVKIYYPYGSLGHLDRSSGTNSVQFGADLNAESLIVASKNIRTFTEGIDNPDLTGGLREVIDWSKHIVFLGFGFIDLNMSLLGSVNQAGMPKKTFGTAFGMSEPNLRELQQIIPQLFCAPNAEPLRSDLKAHQFLDDYARHLFN
jgi:hypothetical protein